MNAAERMINLAKTREEINRQGTELVNAMVDNLASEEGAKKQGDLMLAGNVMVCFAINEEGDLVTAMGRVKITNLDSAPPHLLHILENSASAELGKSLGVPPEVAALLAKLGVLG